MLSQSRRPEAQTQVSAGHSPSEGSGGAGGPSGPRLLPVAASAPGGGRSAPLSGFFPIYVCLSPCGLLVRTLVTGFGALPAPA